MKTTTNKAELRELSACEYDYEAFVKAHGDKDVKLSEALDSNGWDDIWWFIAEAYDQFSDEQKHDLCVFGCNAALINIEKIKPYCSEGDYKLITDYLNNPTEELAWAARSAAWSAESAARSAESAESAAWSAWSAWSARSAGSAAESAAESAAWSAAWSAARSAGSVARSAGSAAMEEFTKQLRDLFVKWELGELK